MKVRVIANPIAGGGLGATQSVALAEALQDEGCTVDLRTTSCAGEGCAFAGEPGAEIILAVGGDGTLNEVINGLGENPPIVGILPVGTANVVARELRFSKDPAVLAKQAARGNWVAMDAGQYDGRRFLLGAGAGLDAAIVQRVSQSRKKRSGLSKWVWPSIATCFAYRFPTMRVMVDGDELMADAQYVVVGNCTYSAGVFPATPRARVDDGLLDVLALRKLSPLRLAVIAATVWRPSFLDQANVAYAQGKHIAIEPVDEPAPLQIDGDPAGETPAEFRVAPGAIRMLDTANH